VRLPAVCRVASSGRQGDRVTFVQISRYDNGVHVRLATDRGCIAQLRGNETHGQRDIALCLALVASRAKLGEHRRSAQCAAPRAEVLCAEARAESVVHVVVHVARGEVAPAAVRIAVAEEASTRRLELSRDELRQLGTHDNLSLLFVALSEIRQHNALSLYGDMLLAQRRYPIGAVLSSVTLAADATEALTDDAQDGCRNGLLGELAPRGVLAKHSAHFRQRFRELAHPVVLAELPTLYSTRVIAVLLAISRVVAPGLDTIARTCRNPHVAPRWWNPEGIDAGEHPPIADEPRLLVHIAKARSLRALALQPLSRHTTSTWARKRPNRVRFFPLVLPSSLESARPDMPYQHLLLSVQDRIATLTVNRPDKLNALNSALIGELGSAIDDLQRREDVAGIILTGAGRAFVAGADISELAAVSALEGKRLARRGQEIFRRFEISPKPTIAAVNGFALGGGCELAMSCQMRIASDGAKFGQPEVKLGLIPGYGGTQRLPRLVGRGRALQLLLTGEMIDAQEAYRIGLVNRVVTADQLMPSATALIQQMLTNAPLAVAACIDMVDRGLEMPLDDSLSLEATQFGVLIATTDTAEGTRAFLEKRAPRFRGA